MTVGSAPYKISNYMTPPITDKWFTFALAPKELRRLSRASYPVSILRSPEMAKYF